jgi:hypothetical protein
VTNNSGKVTAKYRATRAARGIWKRSNLPPAASKDVKKIDIAKIQVIVVPSVSFFPSRSIRSLAKSPSAFYFVGFCLATRS